MPEVGSVGRPRPAFGRRAGAPIARRVKLTIWVKDGGRTVDLFSEKTRGLVLDIPAGRGGHSLDLIRSGFQVVSVDLFPSPGRARQLTWVHADANECFPFRNESFDYVLSREGIEHFENQAGFIRHCYRVLKTEGQLVLTTPNIMHLRSRLSYLLSGQRTIRRGLVNEIQTLREKRNCRFYHGHAFLIDYFRLRYLLRLEGFERIEVFTDRYSCSSVGLLWLAPILFVASKLAIRMSRRKRQAHGLKLSENYVFQEIMAHVFSPALLFGKRMIVVAQKTSSQRRAAASAV